MAADERDLQFERALAKHFRSESDAHCPDAEILAAYHERTLSPEEMSQWKSHIVGCERCQQALSLLEETENVLGMGADPATDPVIAELLASLRRAGVSPTGASTAPSAVSRAEALESAPHPAALPSAKVIELPDRKPLRRWMLPLGAAAAIMLVAVGVYEERSVNHGQMASSQIASNRPVPAPNPAASEYSSTVAPDTSPLPPHVAANESSKAEPSARAKALESTTQGQLRRESGGVGYGSGNASEQVAKEEEKLRQELDTRKSGATTSKGAAVSVGTLNQAVNAPPAAAPFPAPASQSAASGGAMAKSRAALDDAGKKTAPPSMSETVEVQAGPPAVDTSASTTLTDSQLSTAASSMTMNGRNFQDLTALAAQNPAVIVAPNGKYAWRVGAGGKIEHTTNAGKNWKLQNTESTSDLTAGSASSEKVCWVAGKAGTLLHTTDGGKHWNKINTPIQSDLGGVHAVDAQHASIWDVPNRMNYETSDGGATWKQAGNE